MSCSRPYLLVAFTVTTAACADVTAVRPLVVAHRGAPLAADENTIEAFRHARDLGADGIEFDVQMTADGHNVVMHDGTLDRTTTCVGLVGAYTLAELSACHLDNGEPIRTLDEVLLTVGDWFPLIFVEVKGDGMPDHPLEQRMDAAIASVTRAPHPDRVVIISTSAEAMARFASDDASAAITGGFDSDHGSDSITGAVRNGLPMALLPFADLRQNHGDLALRMGLQLCVYGVNTPAQLVEACEMGADIVMTDAVELFPGADAALGESDRRSAL
jgi:glycerophosphoryl diester phosphodiesterase